MVSSDGEREAGPGRVRVLPDFDTYGNIAPSRSGFVLGSSFTVGLDELQERFVMAYPASTTRVAIWSGWMEHRRQIEAMGLQYYSVVNGSFCTDKLNPNDLDLGLVLDGPRVDSLPVDDRQSLLLLFDATYCKLHYRCDPHPISAYEFGHRRFRQFMDSMNYYSRLFGSDRKGREKALLFVYEGGVR